MAKHSDEKCGVMIEQDSDVIISTACVKSAATLSQFLSPTVRQQNRKSPGKKASITDNTIFPLRTRCQLLGNKCSLIQLTGSKINQQVHFKYHFQAITESPALMIIPDFSHTQPKISTRQCMKVRCFTKNKQKG